MNIELPTDDDPVKVIEGDCLDVLRAMPDGCVDEIITDPPYSETTHKGARTRTLTGTGGYHGAKGLVSFDSFTDAEFSVACHLSVRLARRWVLMTCDHKHAVQAEQEMPDEFVRCGVWVKPDGAPQFSGDRPATGWEAVLILHRKGKKRWNGGGHPAVWTHSIKSTRSHPTEKPVGLVRKWIREFTDPGDLILDPFAGSGTTGIAAALEGRRCLLIEKAPTYAEIARQRVRKVLGKDGLFADV